MRGASCQIQTTMYLCETELPDGSVNESGSTGEELDFTDNELLLHGIETTTTTASVPTFSEDFSSNNGWTIDSRQTIDTTQGYLYSPNSNNPNAYITHGFKSYAIGEPDDMVLNWDWKLVGSPFKLPFIQLASDVTAGRWNDPVGNAGGYGGIL